MKGLGQKAEGGGEDRSELGDGKVGNSFGRASDFKAFGGDSSWEIILASYNKYTLHYFINTVIFGTILAVDSHILQSYSRCFETVGETGGGNLAVSLCVFDFFCIRYTRHAK